LLSLYRRLTYPNSQRKLPRVVLRKLSSASFCALLACSALVAQKAEQYRPGRLLSVSDESYISPDGPGKTAYLLHIQDGSNDYFALYSVNQLFGHNRSAQLQPASDVQYRVAGKSLFLKVADSKELKAPVCEKIKVRGYPGLKCGGMTILGKDLEPQT
jgi:hypothetical protein